MWKTTAVCQFALLTECVKTTRTYSFSKRFLSLSHALFRGYFDDKITFIEQIWHRATHTWTGRGASKGEKNRKAKQSTANSRLEISLPTQLNIGSFFARSFLHFFLFPVVVIQRILFSCISSFTLLCSVCAFLLLCYSIWCSRVVAVVACARST